MPNRNNQLKAKPFDIVQREDQTLVIQQHLAPVKKNSLNGRVKIKQTEPTQVIFHLFDPSDVAKLTAIGEKIQQQQALLIRDNPVKRYVSAIKEFLIS